MFWVALGALITTWYDRHGFYRMPPTLMKYIDRAVRSYEEETAQRIATSADQPTT